MDIQPITIGKRLRREYILSPYTSENHSMDQYITLLKELGCQMNPSLIPANFSIRNGLDYPGLATTSDLKGYELLARIPKQLLLTTRIALQEPALATTYKDKFFLNSIYWEHRVLITYLLWVYSRKKGIWYHMVANMSRGVDFICLWEDEQAKELGDQYAYKASRNDKKIFEDEFIQWRKVLLENKPFPEQFITRDNYKWLYAHLFSRCFGRLQSITLVPFCQFMNHHISNVFYDFQYKEGNPHKYLETVYDPKCCKVPQDNDPETSNESDRSYDYQEDIEKQYEKLEINKNNWNTKLSEDLEEKDTKLIQKAMDDLEWALIKSIDWSDGSAIYVAQILQQGFMTVSEYKAGRIKPSAAIKELQILKKQVHSYRQLIVKFYREFRSTRSHYNVNNNNSQSKQPEFRKAFPVFEGDKFDSFTMRLGKKDIFRKDNQVYFRYGRLSNRKMLQCYGMAIEGNKYDHLWIRLDGLKYLSGYPDMLERMQDRRLTLKFKFKLKRREFSMELVLFYRLINWSRMRHHIEEIFAPNNADKEIKVLESFYQMLKQIQQKSEKQSILCGQLKSKENSYHRYFAIVYRLEHIRIVNMHLRLLQVALSIVKKLNGGHSLARAMKHDKSEAFEFWMLRHYLNTLSFFNQPDI